MTTVSDEVNWFRQIFENSSEPAWILEGHHFVDCNAATLHTLGYTSREELLNLHPSELSPDVQEDGEASFTKAERMLVIVQERGFHCFEWLHQRADGSNFLVEVTLSYVNFQGRPVVLCVWTDLSTRRNNDRQLRELLQEQRLIFDRARVGILMASRRCILKCNQHFASMFGYASPADLEGQSTAIFYRSDTHFADVGKVGYAKLASEGFASLETEMIRRDGSRIWVIQSGAPTDPEAVLDSPSIWVYADITERKRAEEARERSEEKFAKAFDSCPLPASIALMEDGCFLEVNASYERTFGWSRADLLGKHSVDIGFWPNQVVRNAWLAELKQQKRVINYETIWLHKSGDRIHVILSAQIINLDGQCCILSYVADVSARKRIEADLRLAAAAFEAQEGMLITDSQGVILKVNRAFIESTGYGADELIGQTPRVLRSGLHGTAFYQQMWSTIGETGSWQGEVWDRRKNGEIYPKWLSITAVKDDNGVVSHYIGSHLDISERKRSEEQITQLAFYDQLTNLPNRTLLVDRLRQARIAGLRTGEYGALLFIDLDNFKTLNDTFGHERGDQLLRQVANRLTQTVRPGDTVARIGGDEFVVVLAELGEVDTAAANLAEMIAGKLLNTLHTPYVLDNGSYRSSASIGITLFQGEQMGIDDLMKQADLAMYEAKESGRNAIRFFDPALESAVRTRAELESDLRAALEQEQLVLFFQPQVNHQGHLTGAEALVRWHHPARGMVSPTDFIPLAEETGLILPLGQFVLDTACRQLATWAKLPEFESLSIAVNVSARQLRQENFVALVQATLARTGANPARLKLELTESVLVDSVQEIIGKMTALRDMGIGFALDDFGTGYSSLSYLRRLPLDQLKIDQSFVRHVLDDPNDATIARTIIALAKALGLGVIAEGVETADQLEFLREAGSYAYQGYLFSRPLPIAAFEAYANSNACPVN